MGYALVGSLGAVSRSLSPSFGQPTAAGNDLICWLAANSNSDTPPFTTESDGWNIPGELQFGTAFAWCAIAYKELLGRGDAAQLGLVGTSAPFSMLGEFSGGAISALLDQIGNGGGGGGADQVAVASGPDAQGGDLIIGVTYWNGGSSGATITTALADSDGNAVTPNTVSNSGGSSILYNFTWGIAGATAGSGGDTLTATLDQFSGGCCGIASFKPAGGGTSHTATASLAVTPSLSAARARGRFRTGSLTVTPSLAAARARGRSRSGSLLVTPSLAAARTHGHGRTASLLVVPSFSSARQMARVRSGSLLVTPSFTAIPAGGAAPAVQQGSWWGLDSVLKQSRQEFEAWASRPPVACPLCGEPLSYAPATNAGSGIERYCRYDGWQYPRDWIVPSRPMPW